MGRTGCVSYLFDRKGLLVVDAESADEEKLMDVALEAGAEDITTQDGNFEIVCEPEAYNDISEALDAAEITCLSKQLTRIPQNTVDLGVDDARKVLRLMEALDDHDDVQSVSANFNVTDDAMAAISAEG